MKQKSLNLRNSIRESFSKFASSMSQITQRDVNNPKAEQPGHTVGRGKPCMSGQRGTGGGKRSRRGRGRASLSALARGFPPTNSPEISTPLINPQTPSDESKSPAKSPTPKRTKRKQRKAAKDVSIEKPQLDLGSDIVLVVVYLAHAWSAFMPTKAETMDPEMLFQPIVRNKL